MAVELSFGQRVTARLAVVALTGWAVVDVLRTTLAIGRYEARIGAVTHDGSELAFAWWAYELVDLLLPPGWTVPATADLVWLFAGVVAATACGGWLAQARHTGGGPDRSSGPRGAWWGPGLLVLVGLHLLARLYAVLTSTDGVARGTVWDTRPVAYPLWAAATVAAVVVATGWVRLIRRTTEDQREMVEGRGTTEPG